MVVFLCNAHISILQEKWNSEILTVVFDHRDKLSMSFAHITWINPARAYLWEGVSS